MAQYQVIKIPLNWINDIPPGIGAGANVTDWADEVPVTSGTLQPEVMMTEDWGKVDDWTTEPVQPIAQVDPNAPAPTQAPSWGGSAPGESWD